MQQCSGMECICLDGKECLCFGDHLKVCYFSKWVYSSLRRKKCDNSQSGFIQTSGEGEMFITILYSKSDLIQDSVCWRRYFLPWLMRCLKGVSTVWADLPGLECTQPTVWRVFRLWMWLQIVFILVFIFLPCIVRFVTARGRDQPSGGRGEG